MKCKNFTRAIKVCSKGPKKTTCGTEEKKVCKVKILPGKCANVTEVKPNSCKKHCQGKGIFIFNIHLGEGTGDRGSEFYSKNLEIPTQ